LCLWENLNVRDVGIHVLLWTGAIDVCDGLSKTKVEGVWLWYVRAWIKVRCPWLE
jgi:hypothetical protein